MTVQICMWWTHQSGGLGLSLSQRAFFKDHALIPIHVYGNIYFSPQNVYIQCSYLAPFVTVFFSNVEGHAPVLQRTLLYISYCAK